MMTTDKPAKDPAATNTVLEEDEDDFCAVGLAGGDSLASFVDADLGEDSEGVSTESRDFSKSSA